MFSMKSLTCPEPSPYTDTTVVGERLPANIFVAHRPVRWRRNCCDIDLETCNKIGKNRLVPILLARHDAGCLAPRRCLDQL